MTLTKLRSFFTGPVFNSLAGLISALFDLKSFSAIWCLANQAMVPRPMVPKNIISKESNKCWDDRVISNESKEKKRDVYLYKEKKKKREKGGVFPSLFLYILIYLFCCPLRLNQTIIGLSTPSPHTNANSDHMEPIGCFFTWWNTHFTPSDAQC